MLRPRFGEHVHHFVFQHSPLKRAPRPGQGASAAALLRKNAEAVGSASSVSGYLITLIDARDKLLALLGSLDSQPADVEDAFCRYLQMLLELADAVERSPEAAAYAQVSELLGSALELTWRDTILPVGGNATSADCYAANSGGGSRWFGVAARRKTAMRAAAEAAAAAAGRDGLPGGVQFEAASAAAAFGSWQLAKAAAQAAVGQGCEAAMAAYNMLCQAAGLLAQAQKALVPRVRGSTGMDLQAPVLGLMQHLALAEAQNLMLQRAVAMRYQGSSIAGMATDTGVLFCFVFEDLQAAARAAKLPWAPGIAASVWDVDALQAAQQQQQQASSGDSAKRSARMVQFEQVLATELPWEWPAPVQHLLALAAYAQYQVGHCYCLATLCAAEGCLSCNKAGEAVALAQLGRNLCNQLQDAGAALGPLLDAHVGTGQADSARRLLLEAMLQHKASAVLSQCMRENRTMYLQYVPQQPTTLAWPQRSAHPERVQFPAPAAALAPEVAQALLSGAAYVAVESEAAAAAGGGGGGKAAAAGAQGGGDGAAADSSARSGEAGEPQAGALEQPARAALLPAASKHKQEHGQDAAQQQQQPAAGQEQEWYIANGGPDHCLTPDSAAAAGSRSSYSSEGSSNSPAHSTPQSAGHPSASALTSPLASAAGLSSTSCSSSSSGSTEAASDDGSDCSSTAGGEEEGGGDGAGWLARVFCWQQPTALYEDDEGEEEEQEEEQEEEEEEVQAKGNEAPAAAAAAAAAAAGVSVSSHGEHAHTQAGGGWDTCQAGVEAGSTDAAWWQQ